MNKFAPLLLSVIVLSTGCASLSSPAQCPAPPSLPPLTQLPPEVLQPSFLQRLESRMWMKPIEPMSFDSTLWPAMPSTNGLRRP